MRAILAPALLAVAVCLAPGRPAAAHDAVPEQIAALSSRIAAEPTRADLYVQRSDLYRAAGDFTKARRDLDRASALAPGLFAAQFAYARLALETHQPAEAIVAASAFLSREPRHVPALLVRARAHRLLGQRAQAVADFSRAIELAPLPDLVIERARVLQASPARLDEALDGIDDGIRRLGAVVTLELEAIEIERRLRRFDAALARVEIVAARSPRKEQWLARRAALLEDAGRATDALEAYRLAHATAESLPPHVRSSRATATLVSEIQHHIDRLTAAARTARAGRSISR
ncbi:MAG TPA: hypothetical protein VM032_03990 [Vicinamibacterales bacterium]|nr:hypothetical protein [Vicinamibacterales bacterium]